MSCIAMAPYATVLTTTTPKEVTTLYTAGALTTGEALNSSVIQFPSVLHGVYQPFRVVAVYAYEKANAAGDIRKPAIRIHLYHAVAPSSPTGGSTYAGSTVGLCGSVTVATADYSRVADNVYEAQVATNITMVSNGSGGDATSLFAVVTSDDGTGYTFAASSQLWIQIYLELHPRLSSLP